MVALPRLSSMWNGPYFLISFGLIMVALTQVWQVACSFMNFYALYSESGLWLCAILPQVMEYNVSTTWSCYISSSFYNICNPLRILSLVFVIVSCIFSSETLFLSRLLHRTYFLFVVFTFYLINCICIILLYFLFIFVPIMYYYVVFTK